MTNSILILEDEKIQRNLYARILRAEGYEAYEAGTIAEAKSYLKKNIKVLIADVGLPDGNGLDFIIEIKKQYPNIEVIVITGQASINDGVKAIKNGAFDYRDLTANNLETNFKAIQNSYELSMLQKNNTLNSLYLWGATLFSIMLIIILVLIIRHLDRSKKNIASLKEFNETIKARNHQLQLTLTELEESRDENTRIMKTVYHDLRGPIGGITMAAGLMLEDPHHTADDEEMLAMIQTSGQDAISLINDMLQITSAVEINKQPVYLPSMLEFSANIAQFKAEEKQQEIIVQSDPILFLLDEEKMRRVIGNLLSNAIKFSPIGGQIILKATETANNLIITCEDFGLGVPEKEKELIFDMFTVAKKMGTNGEETFGMGLAICKQIVAAHGGQINCHPKASGGTIFRIVLKN